MQTTRQTGKDRQNIINLIKKLEYLLVVNLYFVVYAAEEEGV